jgi:hypothetical protein
VYRAAALVSQAQSAPIIERHIYELSNKTLSCTSPHLGIVLNLVFFIPAIADKRRTSLLR